jgi:transcriptional regulator with XRE-family HTH domain
MGSASRIKPERLAEKLLAIRNNFDCSQTDMAKKLSSKLITVKRSDVSRYELGLREPPLAVLLQYARRANVIVDVLIDDELNLP